MNTQNSPDTLDSPSPNIGALEMDQMEPRSPWRPLVVPGIVVVVGLAIAWALFAHFGRTKPNASGAILRQLVYPVQVDGSAPQPGPTDNSPVPEQDETILLVQARVTNISQQPLTIFDLNANVKQSGEGNRSSAALPEDIDRLMQRFPELSTIRMPALSRHQVIAPGKSVEGLMVFAYPWNKQQWSQGEKRQIIISFQRGPSLVLPLQ